MRRKLWKTPKESVAAGKRKVRDIWKRVTEIKGERNFSLMEVAINVVSFRGNVMSFPKKFQLDFTN